MPSKPIQGVRTTTAGFVGPCHTGPVDQPQAVTSLEEYEGIYGDGQPLTFRTGNPVIHYLWQSVRAFFAQGGQRVYIARVKNGEARPVARNYGHSLKQLERFQDISIVAAPGSTAGFASHGAAALATINLLIAHVQLLRYRFAILDSGDQQSVTDIRTLRGKLDSTNAALYFPWVRVLDPISGEEITLPPSGFVAGIYVRNDLTKSVSHAPANEVVNLATGFEQPITDTQQSALNPEGINCLRSFAGRGNLLWGARTISSDPEWRYINIRRYFLYLEQSIDQGTQWVVFDPNGDALWADVIQSIDDFLLKEWRSGSLMGVKPEEAFFVKCDRTTMTQDDIDNGRLVCLVGVSLVKPAEFVIFRIGQWTASRKKHA